MNVLLLPGQVDESCPGERTVATRRREAPGRRVARRPGRRSRRRLSGPVHLRLADSRGRPERQRAAAPLRAALRPPLGARRRRTVLTRRGRLAALAAAVVLLALVTWGGAVLLAALSPAAASDGSAKGARPSSLVVRQGQTVWDIAMTLSPGTDPRPLVHDIAALNHLTDWRLRPGQVLRTPAVPG